MDSHAGVIGSGTFDAQVLDVGDGIVVGAAGGIGDDEAGRRWGKTFQDGRFGAHASEPLIAIERDCAGYFVGTGGYEEVAGGMLLKARAEGCSAVFLASGIGVALEDGGDQGKEKVDHCAVVF